MSTPPTIVLTVAVAATSSEPEITARKNALYAAAVTRAGGSPVLLDATAEAATRAAAFAGMDGLLLTGGADIEPARFGRPVDGATDIQPDRDALEADAWAAATAEGVPILGICRGMQAINVFAGGTLLQHVDGHAGPGWGHGPAALHPLRLVAGSRLARILGRADPGDGAITVNSYHHQGVLAADVAPGLHASAWAVSAAGDLVEGLEAADDRFILGVQCHPERTESTPAAFERLFSALVDAAGRRAPRR